MRFRFTAIIGVVQIFGVGFCGFAQEDAQVMSENDRLALPAPQMQKIDAGKVESMLDFVPAVVASVGGVDITGAQLKGVISPTLAAVMSTGSQPPTVEQLHGLAMNVAGQLVEQQLAFMAANEAGYAPMYELADEKIDAMKTQAGADKFDLALKRQGVTLEQFRKQIADMAAFNKWIQEKVMQGVQVEDEQLQKFYEDNQDKLIEGPKVEAAHILIKLDKDADEATTKAVWDKMREVEKQLSNDVAFGVLAQKHSACPSSKSGGRLEPFGRGEMVKEFEDAAFALKPNEVSDIVKTSYGLHLIKCLDKIAERQIPLDECRDELKQRLLNHKLNLAIQDAVAAQREKTEVKMMMKVKMDIPRQ